MLASNRERCHFMGIASFVLGILSVLCSLFGFFWFAIVLGTVGIVLAALARKKGGGGLTIAGLVLSIVGTSLAALSLVACVALAAWAGKAIGYFVS